MNTLEILVNKAEIIAHSNPSGLDAKTCLSDKAITFIRNIGFSTLDLDLDAYLVIADTGIYGNTREAVEKVAQAEEANLPHLAALGDLTEIVQKAIQDKDIQKIGHMMTKAHAHLQAIGVSIAFPTNWLSFLWEWCPWSQDEWRRTWRLYYCPCKYQS